MLIVAALASCGTMRMAPLAAGNDPEKAVAEVTQIRNKALADQLDVLADDLFEEGSEYLEGARRSLNKGDEIAAVLEKASIAKALFQDAEQLTTTRRPYASRILEARGSALAAGLRDSERLIADLEDVDDDLKSDSKQFTRTLSPEIHSVFEKRYLALEIKAVQFRELGEARKAIDKAIDDEAGNLAPESLRTASLDYETAMNMIAQSPRNPDVYKKSVDAEQSSATLLVDVMGIIRKNSGTPEHIAVQIVNQKRKLGELNTTLKSTTQSLQEKEQSLQAKEQSLQATQKTLQQKEGELKEQEQQLAKASTAVRFQQAMEEARQMIPESDALAYQQGNNLVFRLKRVNFRTGTAIIPSFSKLLLDKVDSIIKKLDAEKVVVQGHTDSVGSELVNKKLSQERAQAVANYLYQLNGGYKIQYAGFGEAYPIASNETEEGRAINRRVDLVVSVKE